MTVDFGLLGTPNFAQAAIAGNQAGRQMGQERRRSEAIGLLQKEPNSAAALSNSALVDPSAAQQYVAVQTAMQKRAKDAQFDIGVRKYTGPRNTLGSLMRGEGQTTQPENSLPPVPLLGGGVNSQPGGVLAPSGVAQSQALLTPPGPPSWAMAPQSAGLLSGAPAVSPAPAGMAAPAPGPAAVPAAAPKPDDGFAQMVDADPERAYAFRSVVAKSSKDELDAFEHVNATAIQLLGGVHDQASYDAAKIQAHEIHERYGVGPDTLALPAVYDPSTVRGLMVRAMTTSQQLAAARADTRLDWDIEDDKRDNARADRNTDSLVGDRVERRGLIARGQDLTDARGRTSIGVASSDRRRGQDLLASRPTTRRGGGGQPAQHVAVDAKGNKVAWDGKAWHPVK